VGGDREEQGRQDEVGQDQERPDGAEEQEGDLGGRAVDKVIGIPGICGCASLVDIIIVARCREGGRGLGGEEGNISTEAKRSEHDDGEDALGDAHREKEYFECCHGGSWGTEMDCELLCCCALKRRCGMAGQEQRESLVVGLGWADRQRTESNLGEVLCEREIYDDLPVIHSRQKGRAKLDSRGSNGAEGRKSLLCMACFSLFRFYVLFEKWAFSAGDNCVRLPLYINLVPWI
jgi:hypothetical protein